jgi:hypothetical protein
MNCQKAATTPDSAAFSEENAREHIMSIKEAYQFRNAFRNYPVNSTLHFQEEVTFSRQTFEELLKSPETATILISSTSGDDGKVALLVSAADKHGEALKGQTYGLGGKVSDVEAAALTANFRSLNTSKAMFESGFFNRDAIYALVNHPKTHAVRIYRGINKAGAGCVVLLPVGRDGKDLRIHLLEKQNTDQTRLAQTEEDTEESLDGDALDYVKVRPKQKP